MAIIDSEEYTMIDGVATRLVYSIALPLNTKLWAHIYKQIKAVTWLLIMNILDLTSLSNLTCLSEERLVMVKKLLVLLIWMALGHLMANRLLSSLKSVTLLPPDVLKV